MKEFALILMLTVLTLAIIGCESGSVSMLNTVLVEDIIENCENEVTEINSSDEQYEVTVILDRPCLDEAVKTANAADDAE